MDVEVRCLGWQYRKGVARPSVATVHSLLRLPIPGLPARHPHPAIPPEPHQPFIRTLINSKSIEDGPKVKQGIPSHKLLARHSFLAMTFTVRRCPTLGQLPFHWNQRRLHTDTHHRHQTLRKEPRLSNRAASLRLRWRRDSRGCGRRSSLLLPIPTPKAQEVFQGPLPLAILILGPLGPGTLALFPLPTRGPG